MGSLALTGKEAIRQPFGPFGVEVRFVPYGDAAALAGAVGPDCAAVFIEPCQGEAGVVPPPAGYLSAARQAPATLEVAHECFNRWGDVARHVRPRRVGCRFQARKVVRTVGDEIRHLFLRRRRRASWRMTCVSPVVFRDPNVSVAWLLY